VNANLTAGWRLHGAHERGERIPGAAPGLVGPRRIENLDLAHAGAAPGITEEARGAELGAAHEPQDHGEERQVDLAGGDAVDPEDDGEAARHLDRDVGRLDEREAPGQERPQHPAAVHGHRRDQVEGAEQGVDPADQVEERRAGGGVEHPAEAGQGEGDRRPGDRDEDLVPRAPRLIGHLGGAAEEVELDAGDPNPEAAGDQGVAELVEQHRGEGEKDHEHAGQTAHPQEDGAEHEQEGQVDLDRKPEQATEAKRLEHGDKVRRAHR
jgi:hypothetical protein